MQTSSPLPEPRLQRRWRRPLAWGFGALVVLELLYNGVLVTGLLATLLSRSTDGLLVEWSRAWSLVPGDVHVRDLKLRKEEANGGHWQLVMEEVEVDISLFSLLKRQLKTESLAVQGLHVEVQSGTQEPGGAKRPPPVDPWQFLLHGVRVHEVRELEWKEARLTGVTEATGNLEVVPGQRISSREAHVKLGPGQLSFHGQDVAQVEQGTVDFTLEVRRSEAEGGIDLITGLEGRLQVSAAFASLEELLSISPRLSGVALRGGKGKLEADLHVKEGRLALGTQLKASGEPFLLPVGSRSLRAPWRFHSDVYTREDGAERLGLKLTLGPVRLEGGEEEKRLETPELLILLSAKAPRVGQPLPDVHLELHATRDNPLELQLLNAWLPPTFQVDSGLATLEVSSHGDPEKDRGSGRLELSTQPFQARWGSAMLRGRAVLSASALKLSDRRDTVTLHGSQLQLHGISVRTTEEKARDWDGTLAFPEATLTLSPLAFEGRFTGSFSNAEPFVALLSHKGALPGVLKPLLTANNLRLSGALSLGAQGVKVSQLRAQGEGLELRGRAESSVGAPRVVLLVKVQGFPVGVEAGADGSHVQVMSPFDWYEEKTGEPQD